MFKILAKNKERRQQILYLTIPVITEQTFVTFMGAINVIMAGRIGKEAAAAIGVVDTLNNIFIAIFSALAVGSTVVVAFYTGQKNHHQANETAKQSLYAGLFFSVLIAVLTGIFRQSLISFLYGSAEKVVLEYALSYLWITLLTYPFIALTSIICGILRGSGDTKSPAVAIIIMNIINVASSYLCIFGMRYGEKILFQGWGVEGAAIGIGIARIIGTGILLYILFRGTLNIKVENIFNFRPKIDLLTKILNIGIPGSVETMLFNTGKLVTQTFIVTLGTVAIVSNYIGTTIHSMMMIPANALSITAVTLVGQSMGRGKPDEAEKWLGYTNWLAIIILLCFNLSFYFIFPFLTSLFTNNTEIIRISTQLLQITAFFVVFWPFSFLIPAGLKGASDVRFTLVISTISMWLFRVTLGYILCIYFKMGVVGIWFGMYLDWIIRGGAFYFRFKNGKWKVILNTHSNTTST